MGGKDTDAILRGEAVVGWEIALSLQTIGPNSVRKGDNSPTSQIDYLSP